MNSWRKVDQTNSLKYENYLLKIPKAHKILATVKIAMLQPSFLVFL